MSGAIGVFDSGVGGLTVFREISRALPLEPLIYLGDSARVPYGTKSPEMVVRYSLEAAQHLLERDIKMLVVACNTATAAALPILRQRLRIPVIGVVEPGARAAVAATRGKVGVIATEGTVRSKAYTKAIHALDPTISVTESAAPLFVPLAEEGWAHTHVAREVAEVYLSPLLDLGIDTLVLGCTHYPILRSTIENVVGGRMAIVDSAETTAISVRDCLAALASERSASQRDSTPLDTSELQVVRGEYQFLVTDATERFRRIAGDFLEHEIEHLELVTL